MVVWKEHWKRCASVNKDPKTTKGIIHFDTYPVHISEAFVSWIKQEFPMFLLCYVPANCTSVMQIADVALNMPLKAQYTNQHMLHLMSEFKKQRADCVAVEDVFYSEAVSKCAGHAMSWLLSAYETLERVDMKITFRHVGYGKCWDCPEFRAHAFARFGSGQKAAAPNTNFHQVSKNEGGWDQELLLQLEEHNAEPEQEQS